MLLLAHAGHWAVNLAFALPAIAFVVWLAVVQVKDRRKQRASHESPEDTA